MGTAYCTDIITQGVGVDHILYCYYYLGCGCGDYTTVLILLLRVWVWGLHNCTDIIT